MVDVLTPEQRRLNMSRIKATNTKPELFVRKALHALGYRFRLHRCDLPGCPDIVLPKYRVVIFVHGCFWHGHECPMFKLPTTRAAFWQKKIDQNQRRDKRVQAELIRSHWRVLTVWECALRGPRRQSPETVMNRIARWLTLDEPESVIQGPGCY